MGLYQSGWSPRNAFKDNARRAGGGGGVTTVPIRGPSFLPLRQKGEIERQEAAQAFATPLTPAGANPAQAAQSMLPAMSKGTRTSSSPNFLAGTQANNAAKLQQSAQTRAAVANMLPDSRRMTGSGDMAITLPDGTRHVRRNTAIAQRDAHNGGGFPVSPVASKPGDIESTYRAPSTEDLTGRKAAMLAKSGADQMRSDVLQQQLGHDPMGRQLRGDENQRANDVTGANVAVAGAGVRGMDADTQARQALLPGEVQGQQLDLERGRTMLPLEVRGAETEIEGGRLQNRAAEQMLPLQLQGKQQELRQGAEMFPYQQDAAGAAIEGAYLDMDARRLQLQQNPSGITPLQQAEIEKMRSEALYNQQRGEAELYAAKNPFGNLGAPPAEIPTPPATAPGGAAGAVNPAATQNGGPAAARMPTLGEAFGVGVMGSSLAPKTIGTQPQASAAAQPTAAPSQFRHVNPKTGQAAIWDGKAWVDERTRKPIG